MEPRAADPMPVPRELIPELMPAVPSPESPIEVC